VRNNAARRRETLPPRWRAALRWQGEVTADCRFAAPRNVMNVWCGPAAWRASCYAADPAPARAGEKNRVSSRAGTGRL
jgi:hypothetical protein